MRRLWKIIKENFPVALAMATTFLSIVYAGMRLMIYVYWMGYFKELNIDANILEINYEGNLFQVIFYGGIILLIVYIFGMLDETYKKVGEQIRNKEGTWLKKLFFAIGKVTKSFLLSFFMLAIANFPFSLVICVMSHLDIKFINFCAIDIVLFGMETVMYGTYKLQKGDDASRRKDWKEKLGIFILVGCLLSSFVLAVLYYTGSKRFENQREVRMVNEGNYIITYSDHEHYVLHRIEKVGNEILVYRNEQKIIGVDDCNYSIRKIEGIRIVDNLSE